MEVMYTPDGKTILIDYVRPQKSFADIEYEKWLKERDAKKENHNDRQALLKSCPQDKCDD